MASLITKNPHISDTVNNMGPYRALRGRVNGLGYSPDARLMPYLEIVGFGPATLIWTFYLQYNLISALVERWRPETHTCQLPCGECTVTLEDVALQLGLPIYESDITGVSAIAELAALCYSLVGALPDDDKSNFSGGVLMLDANNNRVHLQYLTLLADLRNVCSYSWGSTVLAMLYSDLFQMIKPDTIDIGRCLVLLQSWALYRMSFLV
ncbi:protein MAINTENANCE OF MERISTEMS-like [Gossypium arboreum]|uniref:protein MAINTENANCE OF MERISTEMS-like n=1 Tax=Gossypium arboreum TaxID=29729 RepID=UPI0022F16263|nr:protein MAINTENANCE OF MERISTEMS-like [Gossypium arboreum]